MWILISRNHNHSSRRISTSIEFKMLVIDRSRAPLNFEHCEIPTCARSDVSGMTCWNVCLSGKLLATAGDLVAVTGQIEGAQDR